MRTQLENYFIVWFCLCCANAGCLKMLWHWSDADPHDLGAPVLTEPCKVRRFAARNIILFPISGLWIVPGCTAMLVGYTLSEAAKWLYRSVCSIVATAAGEK